MFTDRTDAGHRLADVLDGHDIDADIVLAIPRGGLPVGRAVADRLRIPLDVVAARKIGAPWNPELAVGAVASDGAVWLNDSLIDSFGVSDADVEAGIAREREVAREKVDRYRAGRPPLDLRGKTVIVVDDGVATGATMIACLRQVRSGGAARVVAAVPVAPPDTIERLRPEADEVISAETPPHFRAVGQFYRSFEQIPDERAAAYLSVDEE